MKHYITGYNAIEEYLNTNPSEVILYVSHIGKRGREIVKKAKEKEVPVNNISTEEMNKLAEGHKHRGLLLAHEKSETGTSGKPSTFSEFLRYQQDSGTKTGLVLILDGVQDPHNLGAIIRSCDQFAVDCVVLPEKRSVKPGQTVSRTSVGADAFVRTYIVKNASRTIEECQSAGYWVYGADMAGEPLDEVLFPEKTVIVMGGEGKGLHRLVREKCDTVVAIPVKGHVGSFNVSVAASIFLYEVVRQRHRR